MPRINLNQYFDEDWEVARQTKLHRKIKSHRPSQPPTEAEPALTDDFDAFTFTYNASRHERAWILDSLSTFHEQQWIEDVTRLVKGGKEATVYQCTTNNRLQTDYIAAKIYRPRRFRSLKNDALYREGRQHLDDEGRRINEDGMLHAIQKRTEYGRELMHTSWIEHEFQTLKILQAAGADVPVPYASGNNAILMGFIGDADGPAPALNSIHLSHDEARALFQRTIHNIEIMLANDRIHGDLSAFNILYWGGEITLIDFPQVVQPDQNRNAYAIFQRDVERVCEYFQRQGIASNARKLARDIWKANGNQLDPDVDVRYLDGDNIEDREFYDKYLRGDT
jgi:RIO kinase 1